MRIRSIIVWAFAAIATSAPAVAQFEGPLTSPIRSRIVGVINSDSGAPTIGPGDEIAAIFDGRVVGLQVFGTTATGPVNISITVFGDDPATPDVEGPDPGDQITFQFYDDSTGAIRNNVVPLNLAGEVSIVRYEGDFIDLEIPLPPELLTPVQEFNFRLTAEDGSPGDGSGGGGGGTGQGNPDVNNDGVIDKRDVALVLRGVIGANRVLTATQRARADVNNDGAITTADAVLVIRAQ
ncbi:MAG: dockerin type I repeat-containing protein [Phycisphaerales bacterium]